MRYALAGCVLRVCELVVTAMRRPVTGFSPYSVRHGVSFIEPPSATCCCSPPTPAGTIAGKTTHRLAHCLGVHVCFYESMLLFFCLQTSNICLQNQLLFPLQGIASERRELKQHMAAGLDITAASVMQQMSISPECQVRTKEVWPRGTVRLCANKLVDQCLILELACLHDAPPCLPAWCAGADPLTA